MSEALYDIAAALAFQYHASLMLCGILMLMMVSRISNAKQTTIIAYGLGILLPLAHGLLYPWPLLRAIPMRGEMYPGSMVIGACFSGLFAYSLFFLISLSLKRRAAGR